jgi:DNA repair exonuclease SbcCD ATPase subunit
MRIEAADYEVDSPAMAELASERLVQIATLKKQIEQARTDVCSPIHKAWKNAIAWFKPAEDAIEQADSAMRKALNRWKNEQERIAAAERAERERVAREERQRLEAAERAAAAKALEAQQAAERQQREAAAAAAAGDAQKAEELQQQAEANAAAAETAQAKASTMAQEAAVVTVAPPSIALVPKLAGVSGRMTYSAQVENLKLLVHAIAEGNAPIEAIQANTTFLGQQARAFKKAGVLYPGVTVVAESALSVRAA